MEERNRTHGSTYWWTLAAISGIGGTLMLGLLILLPGDNPVRAGALALVVGLMYFAFGFALYGIYKSGDEVPLEPSVGPYVCRHCGKRFTGEKVWEMHEKTCVEMMI